MIIEGILTTEADEGAMHIAPLGPHVDPDLNTWTLKPFQSSTTFANLHRSSRGVFHIVDDALLLAHAVLGQCNTDAIPAATFENGLGWILADTCGWVALQVREWDTSQPRAIAVCDVVARQQVRPFWGWNRAKHSIVELAIIASRVHLMQKDEIERELRHHQSIIQKTAGPLELAAWELLHARLKQ